MGLIFMKLIWMYSAVGLVRFSRDVFIFTGDIKSNISLNNEAISPDDVRRAAEIVNADPFIQKLPHGYDEPVTERGSTLSAGQRQLCPSHGHLLYDPKILVLDEATANIDTETGNTDHTGTCTADGWKNYDHGRTPAFYDPACR